MVRKKSSLMGKGRVRSRSDVSKQQGVPERASTPKSKGVRALASKRGSSGATASKRGRAKKATQKDTSRDSAIATSLRAGRSPSRNASLPRAKISRAKSRVFLPVSGRRAEKSAARRQAILNAALEEFSKQGFSAARLDDVARRARVAKGTIYVHFRDKEELFRELIRTMMTPQLDAIHAILTTDGPPAAIARRFAELFVREIYGTHRREIVRLMIAEGPRFPKIAAFYYREVVARGVEALRNVLRMAADKSELVHRELLDVPQLVIAPGILAIIWDSMFQQFAPLDVDKLFRVHLDILFKEHSP